MTQEDKFIAVLADHKGILYKVANSYSRNPMDRQDLLQEMIFQLWKSFSKYDTQYKYSTWIYRIALNVAISDYRKSKKSSSFISLDQGILDIKEPENDAETYHQLKLLQSFIYELKPIDKALILLYLEEKSYKEIAEIVGFSESNVGTRIGRIKIVLKEKFNAQKD